ncbi:MAG TPA: tail fiber protein [Mucilaginibacter sp.]
MEGTIGEIRGFAANFAPMNWALCQGQILSIASNTALFSILGTQYGGNGQTTFGLPDLRGRAIVGTGQGNGLSPYTNGLLTGTESVTLISGNLPQHNHIATVTAGTGGSGQIVLNGSNGQAGQLSPGGNILGNDAVQNVSLYAASGTPVALDASTIAVTNVDGPHLSTVTLNPTGGSSPHENRQPSLVVNYIICLIGTYPSRN